VPVVDLSNFVLRLRLWKTLLENSIDIKQYFKKKKRGGKVAAPWQHLSLNLPMSTIRWHGEV